MKMSIKSLRNHIFFFLGGDVNLRDGTDLTAISRLRVYILEAVGGGRCRGDESPASHQGATRLNTPVRGTCHRLSRMAT